MLGTQSSDIHCPYCGERIEIIIDCSIEQQTYVEDCSVCCRPITLDISFADGNMIISPSHENE